MSEMQRYRGAITPEIVWEALPVDSQTSDNWHYLQQIRNDQGRLMAALQTVALAVYEVQQTQAMQQQQIAALTQQVNQLQQAPQYGGGSQPLLYVGGNVSINYTQDNSTHRSYRSNESTSTHPIFVCLALGVILVCLWSIVDERINGTKIKIQQQPSQTQLR